MNILIDNFSTELEVNGKYYKINSDFRNCLKIILAYEDEELTLMEKHEIMLFLLYQNIPNNIEEALKVGMKFLDCNLENDRPNSSKKTYSFDKDAGYIYSAINQTHNIDLSNISYLHWWKFVYMFMDINENCLLSQMIALRQKKYKGKLTKEEKKVWSSMRSLLDLDYTTKFEEKLEETEFMKLWNGTE